MLMFKLVEIPSKLLKTLQSSDYKVTTIQKEVIDVKFQ